MITPFFPSHLRTGGYHCSTNKNTPLPALLVKCTEIFGDFSLHRTQKPLWWKKYKLQNKAFPNSLTFIHDTLPSHPILLTVLIMSTSNRWLTSMLNLVMKSRSINICCKSSIISASSHCQLSKTGCLKYSLTSSVSCKCLRAGKQQHRWKMRLIVFSCEQLQKASKAPCDLEWKGVISHRCSRWVILRGCLLGFCCWPFCTKFTVYLQEAERKKILLEATHVYSAKLWCKLKDSKPQDQGDVFDCNITRLTTCRR